MIHSRRLKLAQPAIGILFVPLLFLAFTSYLPAEDSSHDAHDVTTPPPYDDFIIIPLRVHLLSAPDLPEVDCKLTDADMNRIVGKMNGIWHNAGIHFGLESIRHESAGQQAEFREARDTVHPPPLEAFKILRPEASRRFDGLHLYYVHHFSVNGVYMGADFAFIQETAALRHVSGGIDEPIPRVSAHELGHALGLPHRQNQTNLMASGTTGTLLNSDEVSIAREKALKIKGAATIAAWRQAADAAGAQDNVSGAKLIRAWLAAIPGAP